MKISLVTDSAADLPEDIVEKFGIEVVPLEIQIDDDIYTDGVDIDNKLFYEKMALSKTVPKTSLPSPQAFVDVFKKIGPDHPILCITISAATSGTYQSALIAKDMLGYNVEVIDSLNISMGTGLQVMKAKELIEKGLPLEDIKNEILNFRHTINTFIAIDNLDNVIKGGRISNWKGAIAQVLNIKPILNLFHDGSIKVVEHVRGRRRQFQKVMELIRATGKDVSQSQFVILHAKASVEEIEYLEKKIKELFNPASIIIGELGPIMATHGGFGAIGFAF